MEAQLRHSSSVLVIELSGKMAAGHGDEILRLTVQDQMNAGQRAFLLDLGKVTFIDSSGIGELVATHLLATNEGADLRMLRPPAAVGDVLQITQLQDLIPTHESEEEALAAFAE